MWKQRIETIGNILSTIALIVGASALAWFVWLKPDTTQAGARAGAPSDVEATVTLPKQTRLFGDGRIAVVEFTDFECPFCKQYATSMLPKIRERGGVSYFSVNYPLRQIHPNADAAARAAICAGYQGKLEAMHTALFSAPLSGADITGYVHKVGMDAERYSECMATSTFDIQSQAAIAEKLQISATPTVFVGTVDGLTVHLKRRMNGVRSVAELDAEIGRLAASAKG